MASGVRNTIKLQAPRVWMKAVDRRKPSRSLELNQFKGFGKSEKRWNSALPPKGEFFRAAHRN
jgi:hypothetical protein